MIGFSYFGIFCIIDRTNMLTISKPFLPTHDEYGVFLRGIWARERLSNNGPLACELEARLAEFIKVPQVCLVDNGTQALILMLRAMELQGEVIVPAFTHAATINAVVWAGLTPVFADADLDYNVDPASVASAISPATSAILATHVYGLPCAIDDLRNIAQQHGLALVFDGAHALGTTNQGKSTLAYGDACAVSFHATKIFHTVEGGAVFTHNNEIANRVRLLRNFGAPAKADFPPACVGINAKLSEIHAAMGLCLLPYVPQLIEARRQLHTSYLQALSGLPLETPIVSNDIKWNHAYYPLRFPSLVASTAAQTALAEAGIETRRYFWPALNTLAHFSGAPCPIAEAHARQVLCLPCHHDVKEKDVVRISDIIKKNI